MKFESKIENEWKTREAIKYIDLWPRKMWKVTKSHVGMNA